MASHGFFGPNQYWLAREKRSGRWKTGGSWEGYTEGHKLLYMELAKDDACTSFLTPVMSKRDLRLAQIRVKKPIDELTRPRD